jgi:putative oxidoreductase
MNWLYPGFPGGRGAVGLLALRLVAGAAMMIHGWPKIQHPLVWMDQSPEPPPPFLQAASAVAEFGGGLAWVLGALTPLFSLLMLGNMTFATVMVHVMSRNPFVTSPDVPSGKSAETAVMYLVVAFLLLLTGPGKLSVDYLLFHKTLSPAGHQPGEGLQT